MDEIGNLEHILGQIGLHVPTIWLPRPGIDMSKWAVNAPDQYKEIPEYWEDAEKIIGDNPSTLHNIYPEAFSGLRDFEKAKENIWATGRRYIKEGVLQPHGKCFVLVDRTLPSGKSRKGLVVALDLDKYGPNGLIRPTEATIPERLKIRKGIRENSAVDFSHSIILINDRQKTVIDPLFEDSIEEKLYDFKLMMRGGKIKGYKISNASTIARIAGNIGNIFYNGFWGLHGDGHHEVASGDPLVELINIHDKGIQFYPIHRVVLNVNPEEMLRQMKSFYNGRGFKFEKNTYETEKQMQERLRQLKSENRHAVGFVTRGTYGIFSIENSSSFVLEVVALQQFLDEYRRQHNDAKVEYPHEERIVASKGSEPNSIGFYLPPVSKDTFFQTVGCDGALTPKIFSIGRPDEKRFLIEGRLLKPDYSFCSR